MHKINTQQNTDNVKQQVVQEILQEIIGKVHEQVHLKLYTQKGEHRKRKKYTYSIEERKRMKLNKRKSYHKVKQACSKECKKLQTKNKFPKKNAHQ